jgi:serine/threonine protein kinase
VGLREVRGARAFQGCNRVLAGRYRLDALIGSGGAADVHRGFDLRLRRPVAVKVFRAGTGFDTEDAFRSEAVILARLQHPGLVTAFDAGHHDGDAFLVMQLIDGPTLKSRIAEAPCRARLLQRSARHWPMPWLTPTRRGSSTGMSNRPTSSWTPPAIPI